MSTDWAEWSRQAVAQMQAQNNAWLERYSLQRMPYRWDLDSGALTFVRADDSVTADICVIGTVSRSQGTFLWAWANDAIPPVARRGLDVVRAFGETHDLPLLTTPEWAGGRAEGLEMLAVAGRIQNASGGFVDQAEGPGGPRGFSFASAFAQRYHLAGDRSPFGESAG
jgi:Family of unknown function (DUF6882)